MGRMFDGLREFSAQFLILHLLLVASFVQKTDQHDVAKRSDASGCVVSAFHPTDDAPFDVNKKILNCSGASIASVNRVFLNGDNGVVYKEILLRHMTLDETLNVINEHETEQFKLVDSNASDEQIQKIFHKKNFSGLRLLDVSGNRIKTLERDTFRKSVRLRTLNLARNEINQMKSDVFQDLTSLNELSLSDNKLVNFSSGVNVFRNLRQLTRLDLSNNTIIDIERNMLVDLENLVEINMSYNKLFVLAYQLFKGMKSIEIVDLSHNLFGSFIGNFFIHNKKLSELRLQHNLMNRIDKDSLYGLKELHTLDLSNNKLLSVERNAFDTLDGLQHLNLANNEIQLLSANVFLSLKRLETLDLSNNLLEQLPLGVFAHQFELQELKMDNTRIEKLSNWISKIHSNETINKNILKNMRLVSLRNSMRLKYIESCFFQNLPNIEHLYITSSQLTFLPQGIDEMPKLVELDLFNNQIEFIPQGIKHLTALTVLNLLGNDLQCDCHMYWMLTWIDELEMKNKTLPSELLRLSEMKCRNGYPGDIIRVLQHINCGKPYLIFASKDQTYHLFKDAVLECSFAGTPAPEIVWRTPYGEVLRLDESEVDPDAKFQLKQLHQSVLKDTPINQKYQQIIESAMKNDSLTERVRQGPGITLLENGMLKVHNISRLDAGLYSCFAISIMGNATTDVR